MINMPLQRVAFPYLNFDLSVNTLENLLSVRNIEGERFIIGRAMISLKNQVNGL